MRARSKLMAFLTLFTSASLAHAGPINPPAGPVAPTPGPEPRTAINATNTPGDSGAAFIIPTAGSYYLTGNVTVGGRYAIEVGATAGDVTIDLMGYTITLITSVFPVNPTTGIFATDSANRTLTIRNGVIRAQIAFSNTAVLVEGGANTVIEDVRVHGVGRGIIVPNGATVRRCDVSEVQSNDADSAGIQAGAYSTVEGCRVRGVNTTGITAHIRVGAHSMVRDCQVVSTLPCEVGIDAGGGSMVERNLIRNDDSTLTFDAISCPGGTLTARGNTLTTLAAGTHTGIVCGGASTVIDNVISGFDTGVALGTGSDNLVVRNHFRNPATAVQASFPASNIIGPTVGPGGAAASGNPHANYVQ